jgi:hypothetical protein
MVYYEGIICPVACGSALTWFIMKVTHYWADDTLVINHVSAEPLTTGQMIPT